MRVITRQPLDLSKTANLLQYKDEVRRCHMQAVIQLKLRKPDWDPVVYIRSDRGLDDSLWLKLLAAERNTLTRFGIAETNLKATLEPAPRPVIVNKLAELNVLISAMRAQGWNLKARRVRFVAGMDDKLQKRLKKVAMEALLVVEH
ncbi:unnamed protein product [Prunus armeniaca]|uniref:Uncharacterized protein n=1 Tax=Prunus armeniaca TaxID=36596 RepID=A0A6J5VPP8_PRUAR|nr:unnamed protein product [Prunus armeniaca]